MNFYCPSTRSWLGFVWRLNLLIIEEFEITPEDPVFKNELSLFQYMTGYILRGEMVLETESWCIHISEKCVFYRKILCNNIHTNNRKFVVFLFFRFLQSLQLNNINNIYDVDFLFLFLIVFLSPSEWEVEN